MLQAAMDKERSELLEQVERLEHEQRTLRIRDSGAIDEFGRKVERLRERVAEFKLLSGDSVDTD